MPRPQIQFYYDVVSPWAMFALRILERYQPVWDFDFILKPRYLGGVMVAAGNKPPITVPNKGVWMNSDQELIGAYFGIPYKRPDTFPIQTLHAMRFLRVIEHQAPEKLKPLTDIFYDAVWNSNGNEAVDKVQPKNFRTTIPRDLLNDQDLQKFIELSVSDENKEGIKNESKEVVEKEGAFGFPYIIVTNEQGKTHKFFGADRFEVMAYFLGKQWKGPWPEGPPAASKL